MHSKYQAFLLRLWQEGDQTPWRATVQNPHTGEYRSFSSLAALVTYLEQRTGEQLLKKDKTPFLPELETPNSETY